MRPLGSGNQPCSGSTFQSSTSNPLMSLRGLQRKIGVTRCLSNACARRGVIFAMSRKRRIACMVRLSGCRRPCTWRQFFRTEPDAAHSTSSPVAHVGLATMLPKSTHPHRHENSIDWISYDFFIFFLFAMPPDVINHQAQALSKMLTRGINI